MSGFDLRTIARALGGEVSGRQVLAPGPNHSRLDRSLSIKLSREAAGGFIVKSFADDDFTLCRDYVALRLNLPSDFWRTKGHGYGAPRPGPGPIFVPREPEPDPDHTARIARAVAVWDAASDAHGTIVEAYLAGRRLDLLPGADVLRFHPHCPWRDEAAERTIYVPAMVAAMRGIESDAITAVHRTRLTPEGAKVDRRMLGIAGGAAVKVDADDEVTGGITVGEGVETVLAARQLGFRPAWAVTSANAVASFPVLAGVECLTLLQENDPTSDRAVGEAAERWHRAGREITIITPNIGSDMNDALRGLAG